MDGTVFTVDTDQGVTGLVMMGHGQLRFHPAPAAEKGQVKIFSGADTLDAKFDAAFVRVGNYAAHANPAALVERPVDPRDVKRADEVFRVESAKSFGVDFGSLTRDTWSLLPGADDFLAEIRTKKYDTLTYSRSAAQPEDISLFDRRRQHNIAIYPSAEKLSSRGRFYSEDDQVGYDVLDYDIDTRFTPTRQWIDGRTTIHLKVRGQPSGQLMLRLANSLVVQSIVSDRFGRLFSLRIKNQNTVVVNMPALLMADTDLTLTIAYAGRLVAAAGQRRKPSRSASSRRGSPRRLRSLPPSSSCRRASQLSIRSPIRRRSSAPRPRFSTATASPGTRNRSSATTRRRTFGSRFPRN